AATREAAAAVPAAAASRVAAPGAAPEPRLGAGAPLFPPPAEGEWDPLEAIGAPVPERDSDMLVASKDDGYSTGPGRYAGAVGSGISAGDPASRPTRASTRGSRLEPRHDPIGAGLPYPAKTESHEGTHAGADPLAIFTQAPSSWHAKPKGEADHDRTGASARRGRRRFSLIALVVLLVLAASQLALLFRSEIANAVPALRPAIELFAGAFGLKIEAPRNLTSLSIESTELQRAAGSGNAALHALLRNKDNRTVRWPAMELTLTDQAGAVVLRKVIHPAEYLPASAPRDGLRALSEVPIRMGLDPGTLSIANYSVRLLYP
ncbi:MAG TPA: DUF3426 domain-containing protein, partial [Lautropia sp.]|nr:DUF3426 domain-containing protein [Lautropia sp.]